MRGEGDVIRRKRLITLTRISHSKRFSEAAQTQFHPIVCYTNFEEVDERKENRFFFDAQGASNLAMLVFFHRGSCKWVVSI